MAAAKKSKTSKKPQDGFFLIVLCAFLIMLFFVPIPQRAMSTFMCAAHPGCTPNFSWKAGPSLFERFMGMKSDPGKPDMGTPMPSPTPQACGGFTGETGPNACPSDYRCKYPKPAKPDQQGVCVKR
jgi:hypothetical protein